MIFIYLSTTLLSSFNLLVFSPYHVLSFVIDTEDFYAEHFGANTVEFRPWNVLRTWFAENRLALVAKFCEEVHKRAGNGTIVVKDVYLNKSTLSFVHPQYVPRKIDVLSYSIDSSVKDRTHEYYWYAHEERFLHITQAWRADCIYYLNLFDNVTNEFRLARAVCGVPEPLTDY